MMPREEWSDDRLDDLNKKVDDGFARLDKRMDDGFRKVRAHLDKLDGKFDRLTWGLLASAIGLITTHGL